MAWTQAKSGTQQTGEGRLSGLPLSAAYQRGSKQGWQFAYQPSFCGLRQRIAHSCLSFSCGISLLMWSKGTTP